MVDADDSHNQLARRSQVGEAVTTTLTLSDLPPEFILRIASSLEVRDLLALRRSNRCIYSISQDNLLWGSLLRDLRPPLPRALRSRHLESFSYPELEDAVLDSCRVERKWLKQREPDPTLPAMGRQSGIRFRVLLEFLDDRWIVSIPTIGPPTIMDTREHPSKSYELMPQSSLDETQEATAVVDPDQGDIIIVLLKRNPSLQILRVIPNPHPDLWGIAVEPSRSAVITGIPGVGIEIYDWTRKRSVVAGTTGVSYRTMSELTLGLRSVGDYFLCFRPEWIELLYVPPFSDADEQFTLERDPTSRPFHLRYHEASFQGASLSEPQPNPGSLDDSRVIYILARQISVGFFYFCVTIYDPDYVSSGRKARMDVDLVGVYELNKPQAKARGMCGQRLATGVWLGPEGKRGIWMECPSNEPKSSVVAVSFGQSSPAGVPVKSGDDLQELCEITPRIESTADIFSVDHWDPGDNVVHCAFSEATGKIVLGTLDGRIALL